MSCPRVCVHAAAPGHGVLEHCRSCGGTVTGVDFSPSQGSQGGGGAGGGKVISGKKKKGAAWVKARARLATITCSSGQAFHVLWYVDGVWRRQSHVPMS